MDSLTRITCRLARKDDKPQILELTRTIWEGQDYVPTVWDEWLADHHGRLIVAELSHRVVGLSKLTRLSDVDWWMEGLRVHPQYEGLGIASMLTERTLLTWYEIGKGVVRLATASFRHPVIHLCEQNGFSKVLEVAPFDAPAGITEGSDQMISTNHDLHSIANHGTLNDARSSLEDEIFQAVDPSETSQATQIAQRSASLKLTSDLMDLGWQWAPPRQVYLQELVQLGRLYWWHGQQGLLGYWVDTKELENGEKRVTPVIQILACPIEFLGECLSDFRKLAFALGYKHAAWMTPLNPEILPILEQAGYQRDWEEALFVFAKDHPGIIQGS